MNSAQNILGYIGRVLISVPFLWTGWSHITDWNTQEDRFFHVLSSWSQYPIDTYEIQKLIDLLLPWASAVFIVATVCLLLGGLLLVLSVHTRFAATLLLLCLALGTILYAPFWMMQGAERTEHTLVFMKNLSGIGALLVLIAMGNGSTCAKNT